MTSARSVQHSSADAPSSEEGAAPTPALGRAKTAQGEPSVEGSPEATEAGIAETPVLAAARVEGAATALDEPVASPTAGPESVPSLIHVGEASKPACRPQAEGLSGDAAGPRRSPRM